jgi:hypothetical protein
MKSLSNIFNRLFPLNEVGEPKKPDIMVWVGIEKK